MLVTVRARTDLGRTRDHNEDAFLVADLTRGTTDLTRGADRTGSGSAASLFLVADGMGGAAAGEMASAMAADLIFRHLIETWNERDRRLAGAVRPASARRGRAGQRADPHLLEGAPRRPRHGHDRDGRRACSATALYLAQVGDSRAYLVRGGVATQLTKDQSLMQRLVDAGELTEEEAEQSERRNIILQALGPDATIRVDLTWQELRRGDMLVLCSDGSPGR